MSSLPALGEETPTGAALGGETSRATRGLATLCLLPAANLSFEETERFFRGFLLFHGAWGEAPAPEQIGTGFGPLYNATGCGACHLNDGRGPAPLAGHPITTAPLQIARDAPDGWDPYPTLGVQLQPLATSGASEGTATLEWEETRSLCRRQPLPTATPTVEHLRQGSRSER